MRSERSSSQSARTVAYASRRDGTRRWYAGGVGRHAIAIWVLLLSAAAGESGKARLPAGDWGGDHVRLSVTDKDATVELDCAHGAIDVPIALDREGRFDAKGVFVPEHGGPVLRDEVPKREPARYQGSLEGESMTLRILVGDSGEEIGSFRLTRGKPGRLMKCR